MKAPKVEPMKLNVSDAPKPEAVESAPATMPSAPAISAEPVAELDAKKYRNAKRVYQTASGNIITDY